MQHAQTHRPTRRTRRRALLSALPGLALLAGAAGCADGGEGLSAAAREGRAVYLANCTACHAPDPRRDGALGPAVAGSSRELLEARVVHGTYPPGYTPKRPTQAMAPLPHLAGDIDALHAFLREAAGAGRAAAGD